MREDNVAALQERATQGSIGRAAEEVRRVLADRIAQGLLRPGQRLGSERELAAEFEVSRATLRQALGILEEMGLIHRVLGRSGGTFVSQAKVERDLSQVVGVPALLRSQGMSAGTRVISSSLVLADAQAMDALGLDADAMVIQISRIRLADGVPISFEQATFPADRFPGLLELPLGGSVYELLETNFDTRPGEAIERIEVVQATPDQAAVLGVEPAAPLLSIIRTTLDDDGVPFEYSHDLFRGDRMSFVVRTPGRGGITTAARATSPIVVLRAQSSA